jgi:lipid-A-disaccharide synthase-like uncharacterized protein
MLQWFDSPAHWYVIGFAGQLAFGSRFIVQWLDSERKKRVSIPAAFWYLSLCGGVALLIYALHQKDPVFAFGQAAGLFVYVRNLMLLRRSAPAQ